MKSALIILNPEAGRGKGRELQARLIAAAHSNGWEAEVRTTAHRGHERELAAEARRENWPMVIAVGGDGTVHGTANGLLAEGATDVVLGHVPIGTGNDYARTIGMPRAKIEQNLATVLQGRSRPFDVGRMGDEYFVNALGAGFDAEVVRQTSSIKHLKGFPLYLAGVYKTFASFRAPEYEVSTDEHHERARMMLLEVAIGPTIGGGFRLTPDAVPDDGWFDVCVIRRIGALKFLRYVPTVIRGGHTQLPEVTVFRSQRVTITGVSEPLLLHLDGELRRAEEESITVEMLPRRLRVACAY
jgi:YegS/Rv2252/BmrU family lipid kinase